MKKIYFLFMSALLYISSFAQSVEDTADGRFHDDLLNHFVGKWNVTSIAHGFSSTAVIEADWVLNHQYLHLHFKGNEIIPWMGVPFEIQIYFGYNPSRKRYTNHGMSVHGDDGPFEGFSYAYRTGNEMKTVATMGIDSLIIQRYIWEPATASWLITSNWEIAGKEAEPFLEMKLVAATPSSKKKKLINK